MLISAPFFSSLLYKDDTNCFLDTNHNGKLTVVRILLKVTLIILTIPILPNCVTFIWALSQVPITSSLKLIKFSTVENLFKYSKIFDGRASAKGQVLGSIPDNSKFIEIIGINYASDNNFYYFQPIILRTEIVRNKEVALVIGITSDIREFILSFKNNVITITHSMITNSTADNNFIASILSINS